MKSEMSWQRRSIGVEAALSELKFTFVGCSSLTVDKSAVIRMTRYFLKQVSVWPELGGGVTTNTWTKMFSRWLENSGGVERFRYEGTARVLNEYPESAYAATDYAWSDADPAGTAISYNSSGGGSTNEITDDLVRTVPDRQFDHSEGEYDFYLDHYFAKDVRHVWPEAETVATLTVVPEEMVFTGGIKEAGHVALNTITAAVSGYGKPLSAVWHRTAAVPVEAEQVSVLGRRVGADFSVNPMLPNGEAFVLAATVSGADHVKLTAANQKADLRLASFTMTGDPQTYKIKCDTNVADYTGPHWSKGATGAVTSQPALYVSGSRMTGDVGFAVRGGGVNRRLVVKGEGNGYTFLGTNDMTAGVTNWSATVFATTSLPTNRVDFLNPLEVKWSYKEEAEPDVAAAAAGTSSNQVYVTWKAPMTTAHFFHTAVHVACSKTGATNEDQVVAKTWEHFSKTVSGQELPADVKTWDDVPLSYYGSFDGSHADTTFLLLTHADGQCGGFANLLLDAFRLNGVTSLHITRIKPPDGNCDFGIKNIGYTAWQTFTNDPDGYVYGDGDLLDLSGIAGQNMTTPREKRFAEHIIVHQWNWN